MSLQNHLKIIFSWSKKDFWLIVAACIMSPLVFSFLYESSVLQGLAFVFIFFKITTFRNTYGITPTLQADHQFSWKYLQSLPLPRRDLFKIMLFTDLRYMSLYVVFYVSHLSYISRLVESTELLEASSIVAAIALIYGAAVMMTLSSTINLLHFPRKQFAHRVKKDSYRLAVRNILIVLAVLAVCNDLVSSAAAGESSIVFQYVLFGLWTLMESAGIWSLFALILLLITYFHKYLFQIWIDEGLSYSKVEWKPKRDGTLSFAAIAIAVYFYQVEHIPRVYKGSEVHVATARHDLPELERLVKGGASPDFTNEHGYTPIMIAAETGDDQIYHFLRSKNVSLDGIVVEGKRKHRYSLLGLAVKGKNPEIVRSLLQNTTAAKWEADPRFTLLHLASMKCLAQTADVLIERGAAVNAVNSDGSTPLHHAAREKCFNVTASLLDAGADPTIRNKKGHRALDIVPIKKSDYAYFLERKTRAPAGK